MATDTKIANRKKLLELELEKRQRARESFHTFLDYVTPGYDRRWFHTLIADKCQALVDGTSGKKGLMIFVPPQHGKSEIVSRKLPAWCLGRNPNMKIAGASYAADLAKQFCLNIQRTIEDPAYKTLFPKTFLNNGRHRGYIRNSDYFDTVGYGGFYKAVGVCGGLTGTPVDLGIIDDPIKDALEAGSQTYRDRVWDWYNNVFLTRLHNESKQILIMTRWHADDLAGRLLEHEADEWEVLILPAVKEDESNTYDIREIGEALWPEKHSLERIEAIRKRSPRTYNALYQQRPTDVVGNIILKTWFRHITLNEFKRLHTNEPMVFFLDTAYTQNSENDPTGIIATCKIGYDIYVSAAEKVLMKFPDLIRFIPRWVRDNGYTFKSSIRIEPKANGISVVDQLQEVTGLNITKTPSPQDDKETRLNAASPAVECGRVVLVDGAWNEEFVEEVCGFPSMKHDEYVDLLCYAIDYFIGGHFKPIDLERLARVVH